MNALAKYFWIQGHLAQLALQQGLTWHLCWHRWAHHQRGRPSSPSTSGLVPAHHTQSQWASHKGRVTPAPSWVAKRDKAIRSEAEETASQRVSPPEFGAWRTHKSGLEEQMSHQGLATHSCCWRSTCTHTHTHISSLFIQQVKWKRKTCICPAHVYSDEKDLKTTFNSMGLQELPETVF